MKLARWSLRTVIFLALLAAVLGGTASVGATTASQSAPTTIAPCPTTSNGTVCIAQVSDDYTATTITLTLTVGAATDPTTDPNWANSGSIIKWALYTDGATTSSYSASESVSSDQFVGAVTTSPADTAACDASSGVTTTFSTTANTYALSFPASCLGSPTSLTVEATWSYLDDGTTYSAALPATGTAPCCSVTPDPATTTGSSTTTTSTTTTASTTTTTGPSTSAGVTTTTTTSVAAVVSSPSSTGNTGSGSSGLAFTGVGEDTPVLILAGVAMVAVGILGRRRLLGLARRAKRSRVH